MDSSCTPAQFIRTTKCRYASSGQETCARLDYLHFYIPYAASIILFVAWVSFGLYPFAKKLNHGKPGWELFSASNQIPPLISLLVNLGAVIILFRLKKAAFYLFLTAFGFNVAFDIYVAFVYGWRSVFGTPLLELPFWALNIAIIFYSWHLVSKRVLR
jgi:hypothetical protein